MARYTETHTVMPFHTNTQQYLLKTYQSIHLSIHRFTPADPTPPLSSLASLADHSLQNASNITITTIQCIYFLETESISQTKIKERNVPGLDTQMSIPFVPSTWGRRSERQEERQDQERYEKEASISYHEERDGLSRHDITNHAYRKSKRYTSRYVGGMALTPRTHNQATPIITPSPRKEKERDSQFSVGYSLNAFRIIYTSYISFSCALPNALVWSV